MSSSEEKAAKRWQFSLKRMIACFVYLSVALAMLPNYPPIVYERPMPNPIPAMAWQTMLGGFVGAGLGILFRRAILGAFVGLLIGFFGCFFWELLGFPGQRLHYGKPF